MSKIKCSNCKIEKELIEYYDGHRQCRNCIAIKGKKRRDKNKDKINKRRKIYRENNKEKIKLSRQIHYQNNKEEIHKKKKEYYEEHKEEILNHQRELYQENKEIILQRNSVWRSNNKEKKKEIDNKYRENHKEQINEKQKEYNKNHKEEIAIRKKEYYEENKEEILEKARIRGKIYYEKNKEQLNKKNKEYYKNINPTYFQDLYQKKLKENPNFNKEKYWSQPKCIKCEFFIAKSDYDNHCYRCFCYYNPNDDRIKRQYLFKQHFINDNIIEPNFSEYLDSYDVRINGGCSNKRPDWFFDMGTHSIILECDENQHRSNTQLCEEKREMEIFQDLGNRPIIFIRFNPDKYDDIKGCFYKYKGKLKIRDDEFEIRKNKLIEILKYWINYDNIPDKERTCIYLFYNKIESAT